MTLSLSQPAADSPTVVRVGSAESSIQLTASSDQQHMRRVLFISYAFPPTGGGGVQRSVKFAKYLPENGWRPTILTVANPSVPVQDHDLADDLTPENRILRARTWEPSYGVKKRVSARSATSPPTTSTRLRNWIRNLAMRWLQPDPQVLWNGPAYRAAAKAIRNESHDAVYVTGPPFSSFLLGCRLKEQFNLPLIVDFRDEWMLACRYLDNHQHGGRIATNQHRMMQRVLSKADAVIATTMASAKELEQACDEVQSHASVSCIYNGFDPSDIPRVTDRAECIPRYRLVYTGTLWRLTDIGPLVAAIESLERSHPELTERLELVIAGRRTADQDACLERVRATRATLTCEDYLPHRSSLELASSADGLLLLLASEAGAERVVPAKLFEYLALGIPILGICPHGEAAELLKMHGKGQSFAPENTDGVARWLSVRLDGHASAMPPSTPPSTPPSNDLNRFSRPFLTTELATVLTQCVGQRIGVLS